MNTVKGYARIEQLVPFEADLDADDLAEWLDGEELTDDLLTEYMKSSPDWWMDLGLEKPSWRHEVTDYDIASAEIGEV